jgi:ribosome recycling factor
VSTDEEQVKSAIRNLKNSMKETIEKKKKEGKTTEIQANKPKVLLIR